MNFLTNQRQGTLCAISSGLCYGFLGYFGTSLINAGLSVCNMSFWRFFVATIVMFVILLPKHKMILQTYANSLKMLFYGVAFYGASTIAYFTSSQYIGTGAAMVILFIYPALIMLFNVIFHKAKLKKIYYFAFTILIGGIACLIDIHKFTFNIFGIGLGMLSALFYAFYMLASKKTTLPSSLSTLMVSAGCMIACLITSYIDSSFFIPSGFNVWLHIISMAVVCTALPILLLLQGLKYISTEKAAILSVLEPVFVVIFGILLLNENITNLKTIGMVMVLCGASLILLWDKSSTH